MYMNYFVYIVECKDGTYYCGYTTNLENRVREHNDSKTGAKYTKPRRPVKLIYSEQLDTKSQAMKREIEIKQMNRKGKEALIET